MPEGQVLEFSQVTKRFGAVTAVSDLSVRVEPGAVTGFLGPNGAGKTTSLRILLGQIRPTSGTATIGGANYSELRHPLRTVGAVLEESAYRPRRTASRQLLIAAKANGIPSARVDEVLRLVGLQEDADTRLGSYSLGMRQRLAVACALLGDPGVLVLDEPANGLDPEGIRWMRLLMRRLADEGRTVLVSSHVLSEIEQVADNVVVLSKGRAVHAGPISELADASGGAVVVDAENRAPLITALSAAKLDFDVLRSGVTVRDSDSATVGAVAAAAGVALTMLQQRGPSLEEVFLDLVYGRRSDSPRLDTSANPVAHAPLTAPAATGAGDVALVAGGVPLAGAAAVVADGGMVAAAGAGYGAAPGDDAPDAVDPGEHGETVEDVDAGAEPDAADSGAADDADVPADAAAEQSEAAQGDEPAEEAADATSSDEARAAEQSDDDLVDGLIEAADAEGDADPTESGEHGAEADDEQSAEVDDEQTAEADGLTTGDLAVAELFDTAAVGAEDGAETPDESEHQDDDQVSGEDRADEQHGEQQSEEAVDGAQPDDEQGHVQLGDQPAAEEQHGEHDAEEHTTDDQDGRTDADAESHHHDTAHNAAEGHAAGEHHEHGTADDATHHAAEEHAEAEHDEHTGEPHDEQHDGEKHEQAEHHEPTGEQHEQAEHHEHDGEQQHGKHEQHGDHHEHEADQHDAGAAEHATASEPSADEQSADEQSADEQSADEQSADEQSADEQSADEQSADEQSADEHPASESTDSRADEPSDETRPLILPLATEAVTLPSTTTEPTFTELITGIPASVTPDGADSPVATEAISIVTPELSHDEDEDAVDDGDDDPRLAAMRTSLSAAASRFFDGPAPDYPYSSRAERREDAAAEANDEEPAQHDDAERNDHS